MKRPLWKPDLPLFVAATFLAAVAASILTIAFSLRRDAALARMFYVVSQLEMAAALFLGAVYLVHRFITRRRRRNG